MTEKEIINTIGFKRMLNTTDYDEYKKLYIKYRTSFSYIPSVEILLQENKHYTRTLHEYNISFITYKINPDDMLSEIEIDNMNLYYLYQYFLSITKNNCIFYKIRTSKVPWYYLHMLFIVVDNTMYRYSLTNHYSGFVYKINENDSTILMNNDNTDYFRLDVYTRKFKISQIGL